MDAVYTIAVIVLSDVDVSNCVVNSEHMVLCYVVNISFPEKVISSIGIKVFTF